MAASVHVGIATVSKVRREISEGKDASLPTPSNGRLKLKTDQLERLVIRKLAMSEYKDATDSSKKLSLDGYQVAPDTIRRTLKQAGFYSAHKRQALPLTSARKKKRYEFAQKYRSWTVEDWKRVNFSDETKVNRFGSDGAVWTWIAPDGIERDHNLQHLYKHGGGSLMVWGCFSYKGVGYMARIDGRMNAELYCEILDDEFKQTPDCMDSIRTRYTSSKITTQNIHPNWLRDGSTTTVLTFSTGRHSHRI